MHPISRRRFLRAGAGLTVTAGAAPVFSADPAPPPAPAPDREEKQDPYADAVLVKGEPPPPEEGSFTLVALPDTQHYCAKYPESFVAQTRWIAEQRETRRIAAVLHLGDITNNNTPGQWKNAVKAMQVINGKVPSFMAPGNHDYGPNGNGSVRESSFTKYFPPRRLKKEKTFGGFYDREVDRVENSYHLFSAGGRDFVVLCLEFGPRRDVVRWANEVVAKHSAREAILVTHAFTYYDDARYDWKQFGEKQRWNPHDYGMAKSGGDDVSDGEELWQNLICKHKNFIFTINGHVLEDGLGRLTSSTPDGRAVHQMLVNFQMRPRGGDGWLRLLEFRKDGSLLAMDYSPVRGERNESPQNRFDLKLSAHGS